MMESPEECVGGLLADALAAAEGGHEVRDVGCGPAQDQDPDDKGDGTPPAETEDVDGDGGEGEAPPVGPPAMGCWHAGPIFLEVATSLVDDTRRTIDVTPTLGHGKHPPKSPNDENCYWLPAALNRNDEGFRKARLHPLLTRACAAAGFRAFCSYRKRGLMPAVSVVCARSVFHRPEKRPRPDYKGGPRRKRRSQRPSLPAAQRGDDICPAVPAPADGPSPANAVTCTFKFCAYWDDVLSRWLLPHRQSGSAEHRGHSRLEPGLVRLHGGAGVDQNEHDGIGPSGGVAPPEKNSYEDFLPVYRQLCNLANGPGRHGEVCHDILEKGLDGLKRKMLSLG